MKVTATESINYKAPKLNASSSYYEEVHEEPITAIQLPLLGGLLWVQPLQYQLIQQMGTLLFAMIVIIYLRRIASK